MELPPEGYQEAFTSALLPLLMETPVLRILSKLQRTLDVLDIEGLSNLWCKVEGTGHLFESSQTESTESSSIALAEPTISEWTEFLDRYLSPGELDHMNPRKENLRYYLLAFLLSTTFKDCSMMIRLNLLGAPGPFPERGSPEQVTVIDLDPKSMDRLKKWEKLDREIVEASLSVDNRKTCIDSWKE